MTARPLRLGEFVATLALAQDNAFGQPLESQLRSCLLADWICRAAGVDDQVRETAYWVALLRYVGCTGHAHEVAALFGDDIAIRGQTLVHDAANVEEVMGDVIAYATAGRDPAEHAAIVAMIHETAVEWVTDNSRSGCEAGDLIVQRLGLADDVRKALGFTFERWNGHGFPAHAAGEQIPLAMRIVHLSHDMEAIGRRFSPQRAVAAAAERSDRTYDPALAGLFVEHGIAWFEQLAALQPWDAVLDIEPHPHRLLEGDDLDHVLLVAADLIDVKSPYMAGHSRRCSSLAAEAARGLGLPDQEVAVVRRAALVHEFGITAVPNSVWDKPGALTRAELDRVELHPMVTDQMLRRSPALDVLRPIAAAHHERSDGSGYPKGLRLGPDDLGAAVLAAVEVYVGMTAARADHSAHSPEAAAAELRRLSSSGLLDDRATHAVLVAAGQAKAHSHAKKRNPGGLSSRELEVLELAARGLTKQQIAKRLFISPKTADHHIQHIYTKIGVSTRAGAALWAIDNGVLRPTG